MQQTEENDNLNTSDYKKKSEALLNAVLLLVFFKMFSQCQFITTSPSHINALACFLRDQIYFHHVCKCLCNKVARSAVLNSLLFGQSVTVSHLKLILIFEPWFVYFIKRITRFILKLNANHTSNMFFAPVLKSKIYQI